MMINAIKTFIESIRTFFKNRKSVKKVNVKKISGSLYHKVSSIQSPYPFELKGQSRFQDAEYILQWFFGENYIILNDINKKIIIPVEKIEYIEYTIEDYFIE